LVASDGGARAVVCRTFYVSTGYNAEQSVASLLPVAGGTVVLYMTHAFTDQVAGSGGSVDEGDLRDGPKAHRTVGAGSC
jgi:hypothetical protein